MPDHVRDLDVCGFGAHNPHDPGCAREWDRRQRVGVSSIRKARTLAGRYAGMIQFLLRSRLRNPKSQRSHQGPVVVCRYCRL